MFSNPRASWCGRRSSRPCCRRARRRCNTGRRRSCSRRTGSRSSVRSKRRRRVEERGLLGVELGLAVAGRDVGRGAERVAGGLVPAGAAALEVDHHVLRARREVDADAGVAAVRAVRVVELDEGPGLVGRGERLARRDPAARATSAGRAGARAAAAVRGAATAAAAGRVRVAAGAAAAPGVVGLGRATAPERERNRQEQKPKSARRLH